MVALVALAFVEPRRRSSPTALVVSALCFGWAIAFKQSPCWYSHRSCAISRSAATTGGAHALTFHDEIRGANILNALAQFGDPAPLVPLFTAAALLGTLGLVALVVRWHVPTLGAAALAGAGIVMVPLLFARWTTQPYYVYVGAIGARGIAIARH